MVKIDNKSSEEYIHLQLTENLSNLSQYSTNSSFSTNFSKDRITQRCIQHLNLKFRVQFN